MGAPLNPKYIPYTYMDPLGMLVHPRESVPMLAALPPDLLSCIRSEEKAAITNSEFQGHGSLVVLLYLQ